MTKLIPWMLGGCLALGLMAPAQAQKGITVEDPWVREAPPGIRLVAAYMTLKNQSRQADRLISVTSPLASEIEIHRMTIKDGMMDMEAIPFLTIPGQGEAKLKPGGNHLMIYGLKQELREGDRLPLTLTFERAGTLKVQAPVRKVLGKH